MPAEGRAFLNVYIQPSQAGGFFILAVERAVIFVNGVQIDPAGLLPLLDKQDYLVAADGGLRFLQLFHLQPHLLIGDFDSISQEEIDQARANGADVRQYPIHKDETDLELAIDAVLQAGYRQIWIVGGLGGRLDMTLGNLYLLLLPELKDCDVRLEDGLEEVFLIRPGNHPAQVCGKPGERVSLLPLNGPAEGVRTQGLYYPLRGETLYQERTRGISNVLTAPEASITLQSGILCCIHTRLSS
jgi:thiamine pyrophosphokinase